MAKDPADGGMPPPPEPPPAPPASTSGPEVDAALDPGRVGPVKLRADRPAPAPEDVARRVGPERLNRGSSTDTTH